MLIDALVYGTARLTGGASARESRGLLRACLDAGIRHVDTAPSYGLGTAEQVVGEVLRDRPDVRVTAKVGTMRPAHGMAKTYLRWAKGKLRKRASPLNPEHVPQPPPRRSADGHFGRDEMARSLDLTQRRLGRDRLDVLLLHECYVDDATPEVVDFLERARAERRADILGHAIGTVEDPALASRFPADFVGQAALPATADLANVRARYLHSIANATFPLIRSDEGYRRWSEDMAARLAGAGVDATTAQIAAGFAYVHARLPDRKLIFATIDPGRLAAFLRAVGHVDREIDVAAETAR